MAPRRMMNSAEKSKCAGMHNSFRGQALNSRSMHMTSRHLVPCDDIHPQRATLKIKNSSRPWLRTKDNQKSHIVGFTYSHLTRSLIFSHAVDARQRRASYFFRKTSALAGTLNCAGVPQGVVANQPHSGSTCMEAVFRNVQRPAG